MSSLAPARALPQRARAQAEKPRVLVLSSSLLTDRMLLYTDMLRRLAQSAEPVTWVTSIGHAERVDWWNAVPARVETFPPVQPFKEFPYNVLRRLNERVWDLRLRPPTRLSARRHIFDPDTPWYMRALQGPAHLLALLRLEQPFESWLEGLLVNYPRSAEGVERLLQWQPHAVVTTGPYRYEEPAVTLAAKRLGIPTLALITSWDNLSTKRRLVPRHDGYLVWSEHMRKELYHFYPQSRMAPTYVVGAPQFDVFFQDRFRQSREEFCAAQELDVAKPIIVYALGSPNFVREHHGAVRMAERVAAGDLGDVQLLVRPHPLFDDGAEAAELRRFGTRVRVQHTGQHGARLSARSQSEAQIIEWANTFRHAAVVVNLSSTATVDAALFDRPVVNLDYDPEPGQPNQAVIKDANHVWTHFKPVAESGGVWLVNNFAETMEAVRGYLRQPELHRERRRWITQYVCGYTDGRCGERMGAAIEDFLSNGAHRH